MANSSSFRQQPPTPIAEEDPFAELTRIMGFDPRVKITPRAQEQEPDFGIDLERELLGEFEREFETAPAATAKPAHSFAPAPRQLYGAEKRAPAPLPAATDSFSGEPVADFGGAGASEMELELLDMLGQTQIGEGVAEVHVEPEASASHEPVATEDELVLDLDLEELTQIAGEEAPRAVSAEPIETVAAQHSLPESPEPVAAAPIEVAVAHDDEWPVAQDWRQALEQELPAEIAEEASPAAQSTDAWAEELADEIAETPVPTEESDEPLTVSTETLDFLPETLDGSRPDVSVDPHEVDAFGEEPMPQQVYTYDGTDGSSAEATAAPFEASSDEEEAWTSFDPAALTLTDEPVAADFVPNSDEPISSGVHAEHATSPEPVEAPAMQPFDQRAFDAALAEELDEPATTDRPAATWSRGTANPSIRDSWARPVVRAPSIQADAPSIETVDFVENRVAPSDELDLPSVDYVPEPARREEIDDFDADFASAFNALNTTAPVRQQEYRPAPAEPARSPTALHSETGSFDATDQDDEFEPHYAASPLNRAGLYEPEYDDVEAQAFYQQHKPRFSGRMIKLGGVVAALALVVGVGFFTIGGGSSSVEGTLVRADTDPMKVRPENPGGATVPNQTSAAYERVGSGQAGEALTQARLIDTAEEPVDLIPPQADASLEGLAAFGAGAKGEDRLEIDDIVQENTQAPEMVAVAPRRVRTMIVKPDGTLVAREEPIADDVSQVAGLEPQASSETVTDMISDAVAAEPAELEPASTGTVPTQAAAEAPAEQTAETPPVAEEPVQTARVEEPSAAALAPATSPTSAWSVQISSQPNAAAAQESYASLSRRYASVLDGKGVNIVQADIAGKGTFYRVRIPAETRAEANSLCSSYKAAGGSCFVTQ